MRILTISNCPLLEHQGSGYVIVNYAKNLRELGDEVELHGPEDYELFHGKVRRGKYYRQVLGMSRFAAKRVRDCEYDVVEFYGAESHAALKALKAHRDRKFITVLHSNGIELNVRESLMRHGVHNTPGGRPARFYNLNHDENIRSAFQNADGVLLVGKFEEDYAKANRLTGRFGAEGIANPLPEIFLNVTPHPRTERVLGYCGSWIERKGVSAVREGATRLLRDFPDWRLLLVGVGDGFDTRAHFADVADRVQVIPFVKSKDQMIEMYQRMTIMVVPSYYESFGLVTAEAMACGVAVVASRTGFAAGLKDREEAMLMAQPTAGELHSAASELMRDDGLRARIAQAGWERVQSLRWQPAAQRVHDLYAMWLDQHRAGMKR